MKLLLVHGRDQQGKDRVDLRRKWVAGLAKGLVLAGHDRYPPPDEVLFPFYGDYLSGQLGQLRKKRRADLTVDPLDVGVEALETVDAGTAGLTGALIVQAAQVAGYEAPDDMVAQRLETEGLQDLLGFQVIRDALSWLARKTGMAELVIQYILRDVAVYLGHSDIREKVLEIVAREAQGHDQLIVVGHSLGSVVAHDLMARLPGGVDVPLFVTAGSPLGLPAVGTRLLSSPLPEQVEQWVNAYDPRDVVAIVNPLSDIFGELVSDEITSNPSGPHSIQDYLADPDVARPIGNQLARTAR